MVGVESMRTREKTALEARGVDAESAKSGAAFRVVGLFLLVVLGVVAAWFWDIGSAYLASEDPNKTFQWGTWADFGIRAGLAVVVALLTFPTIYEKVGKTTKDSWIAYFLAFQNGFFWQAVFEGVKNSFS